MSSVLQEKILRFIDCACKKRSHGAYSSPSSLLEWPRCFQDPGINVTGFIYLSSIYLSVSFLVSFFEASFQT